VKGFMGIPFLVLRYLLLYYYASSSKIKQTSAMARNPHAREIESRKTRGRPP
jgi:hypothetical protein